MTTTPETTTSTQAAKKKNAYFILGGLLIFIVLMVVVGSIHSAHYPSTDDSYIKLNIINIAPQVGGPVSEILVKNHEFVKKGQLLVQIDPRPYQYAVEQAEAQLKYAQAQGKRNFPLIATGQVAPSVGDQISANIKQYKATLETAKYNLDQAYVVAPADGIIANFTVRVGDNVIPQNDLFAIVEQQSPWAAANFKETQLKRIRVGQQATIKVDMYPNYIFRGTVESISPGAGTVFSLLPPENATGNWVKVTQRIPVKIIISNPDPRYPLIAGTSATVTVDTVHGNH
jgi:membrane fusion protein (multidrug efflux system)